MDQQARSFCALLAATFVVGWPLTTSAHDTLANIGVEQKLGAAPDQFDLVPAPDGAPIRWTVIQDASATHGLAIEQSGPSTAASPSLAIYKDASLKNADISLRLKAIRGSEGRGGGIAVRLTAPDTYYLVQLDARRDRVLFSCVTNGVSEEIVGVDADIASNTWHTLAVQARDDEFVVSLDDVWIFTGFDKTLPQAGRIALWTSTDSVIRFDSIAITPLLSLEQQW
jgi:hypothetical protein